MLELLFATENREISELQERHDDYDIFLSIPSPGRECEGEGEGWLVTCEVWLHDYMTMLHSPPHRDSLPGDVTMITIFLLVLLTALTSSHPCLSTVGRTSEICQQLLSLCSVSTSSPSLPICRSLLDQTDLDNLPEEQRIDLGLAVLEPSIGEALSRTLYWFIKRLIKILFSQYSNSEPSLRKDFSVPVLPAGLRTPVGHHQHPRGPPGVLHQLRLQGEEGMEDSGQTNEEQRQRNI